MLSLPFTYTSYGLETRWINDVGNVVSGHFMPGLVSPRVAWTKILSKDGLWLHMHNSYCVGTHIVSWRAQFNQHQGICAALLELQKNWQKNMHLIGISPKTGAMLPNKPATKAHSVGHTGYESNSSIPFGYSTTTTKLLPLSLSPWGKKRDSMTIIRSSYIIVTSFFFFISKPKTSPSHSLRLSPLLREADWQEGRHKLNRALPLPSATARGESQRREGERESWSMQQRIQHRWQEHVWASDKAILGRNCQCISKGMPTAKIREDLHCALDCLGCKIVLVLYFFWRFKREPSTVSAE